MLKLNKTIKLAIYCSSPKIDADRKALVSLVYLKKDFSNNLVTFDSWSSWHKQNSVAIEMTYKLE